MGTLLTKFRKQKTTAEVLESLQERIDALEKFTFSTEEKRQRVVGTFLAVTVGIYMLVFVLFYFVYFPPTWKERIIYSTPLILFPSVIILCRNLCSLYFQRKLNKNSKKLAALKAEKKKMLEQVMDKETYRVAISLLARFGDKPTPPNTRYDAMMKNIPSVQNRPLLNPRTPNVAQYLSATPSRTQTNLRSTVYSYSNKIPSSPVKTINTATTTTTTTTATTTTTTPNQQLRQRTPFPVVNAKEQSVFDRIVDALVGDGPQNRYAMICKFCFGHNGMALKDDFEYATYRCIYCGALNPAKKLRPVGPRLSVNCRSVALPSAQTSEGSTDDTSDSDEVAALCRRKSWHTDDRKSSFSRDNINDNNKQDNTDEDKAKVNVEDGSDHDNRDNTFGSSEVGSATLVNTSIAD